jgi:hypothetical protein
MHRLMYRRRKRKELAYTYSIMPQVHKFTADLGGPGLRQDSPLPTGFVNWQCQLLFETVFPEIAAANKHSVQSLATITIVTEWADPVTLSLLRLPRQKAPSLEVTIFAEPTFRKRDQTYDLLSE